MIRFVFVRRAILASPPLWQNALYLCAAVALPTLARMSLGTRGDMLPFAPYYPAVLLTAVFLGWRWALAGTVISSAIVNRYFLAHPFSQNLSVNDIGSLVLFFTTCALLILIGQTLRRTVHELDALARHNEMLSQECHHRVKNVLGVILAIIRMADRNCTIEDYRDDLEGRIHALSWANHVLLSGPDASSSIRGIIGKTIEPFANNGVFLLEGEDRPITLDQGHHLVLILHELATNAIKHGALTVEQGRVRIAWSMQDDLLQMVWQESGGPPVTPPTRRGLGSRLMAGQHAYDINLDFHPAGLRCTLTQLPEASARAPTELSES